MEQINENRPVAIKLSGVKKRYKLGQIGGGTLQADLQSWWARKRGKEDPNTKIGQDQRLVGQTFMALNGVDLTVYQGEALGIIGKNGAGKSTLLKLLSRVTAPTEGDIDLYGRIASMLEVGTGFNPEMTGRENVYMNGAILGMTKAEIDAKMDDIIEFSEVREFIDTPVKRYSSGMYVKLAFSVAAHLDSEIMIMDEVLAVGDMAFQKKCLDKMRDAANKEGRTVLYVSHNMNTIKQLCNRCIVLNQGKIIFDGDVEEAINVYMGRNNSYQITNTFSTERGDYVLDGQFIFKGLTILEKDYPLYSHKDEMKLRIEYQAQSQLENLSIRIVVQSAMGDNVGLATTGSQINVIPGCGSIFLSFLPTTLATGKYSVKLVAYSINEFGNGPLHDVIDNAFSFEIDNAIDDTNNMIWNSKAWGYITFPKLQVNQN